MKNQTLRNLEIIRKRLNIKREERTFRLLVKESEAELDFLANKFNIDKAEALLFAVACICTIEHNSIEFDIDDISHTLGISIFETLLYQQQINSLKEKEIIIEYTKESGYNKKELPPVVEIMSKEFVLHPALDKHFL